MELAILQSKFAQRIRRKARVRVHRENLLGLLRRSFGNHVTPTLTAAIKAVDDPEQLHFLFEQSLEGMSLEDLRSVLQLKDQRGAARICPVPNSFAGWATFLHSTLDHCHEDLARIFDGASIRELWLQGELYLAAKRKGWDHLYVNYPLSDYSGKPDMTYWASHKKDAALLMVGEIKLLGLDGYEPTNFDGRSSIRDYTAELETCGNLLITPSRLESMRPEGGLLMDYKRLVSYGPNVLKMLVLVLDVRGARPNALGKLLKAVEFESAGRVVFENNHVLCKAWEVKGRYAAPGALS